MLFDNDGIQKHFFGLKEALVSCESLRHEYKLKLINDKQNTMTKTELLKEKLNISPATTDNKPTGISTSGGRGINRGGRGGRGMTNETGKSSGISMYDKSQLDSNNKKSKDCFNPGRYRYKNTNMIHTFVKLTLLINKI